MNSSTVSVCVIGAGFSGSMVATHLLAAPSPAPRVALVEKRQDFGPGTAYGTRYASHLLNVPAARMSAFADQPGHFAEWLSRTRGASVDPGAFAQRREYGAYLRDVLALAEARAERHALERIADRAIAVERSDGRYRVRFETREPLIADVVVLATGHLRPGHPPIRHGSLSEQAWYRPDPWDGRNLDDVLDRAHVVLIGAGLTAVDQLLALRERGHTGVVTMLSRTGLLPRPHGPSIHADPCLDPSALPTTALGLFREIRSGVQVAVQAGGSWRSVLDSLRPLTAAAWMNLTVRERRRLLRHARSVWEVHRHRVPREIAQRLEQEQLDGRLSIVACRLVSAETDGSAAILNVQLRGSGDTAKVRADLVINCTGPECDYRRAQDPLMLSLLEAGLVRMDALQLGIDVSAAGAVRSAGGEPSPDLLAIGPLRKGALWETTAVPELRVQALEAARTILGSRATS